MGVGDIDFAVRYPFTSAAKELLKTEGLSTVTDEVVERAVRKITDSLHGRMQKKVFTRDEEKREDLLAYAVARMILSHLRNGYITNKFAVAESKKIRSYLNDESEEIVDSIAGEVGIFFTKKEKKVFVSLPTFLRFTPRSPHYQLINRALASGLVLITETEKKRMIEEAVRKHNERIPLVKNPLKRIAAAARKVMDELPRRRFASAARLEDSHPPCIAELLDAVKRHQNLPHQARFYLVVYLIGIGLSDEEIIQFYSNFPDFNEKITKYQVGHARKRGYSVPSCATIVGYGLCRANCGIRNPLSFSWHKREKR